MTKANEENRYQLNKELAQMLKGGVIMDVTTPEQAKSPKLLVPALLWPLNVFQQISVLLAALPV